MDILKIAQECGAKVFGTYIVVADGRSSGAATRFVHEFHRRVRAEALEEAAKVCETLVYGMDIDEWIAMTKKEHGARACHECASAIRALAKG